MDLDNWKEGPKNFFSLIFLSFKAFIIKSFLNNLETKEYWLRLYGMILYRVLDEKDPVKKDDLFRKMFIGEEGFRSIFKPRSNVGLMWKMTLLCLGYQKVCFLHLFGNEDVMASRFHFFQMHPNKNIKIYPSELEESCSESEDFVWLLNTMTYVTILHPKEEEVGKKASFYNSVMQKKLEQACEMANSNSSIDGIYYQLFLYFSDITMIPSDYIYNYKKIKHLTQNDPILKIKYAKMKKTKQGKNPGFGKNQKSYLGWSVENAMYKIFSKIHFFLKTCKDPYVFFNQFDKTFDQNHMTAINDRDAFATECMTRYLNKTGSAWCVNRELGNIKFFWLFPKLISYANHYWKVNNRCSLRTFIEESTENRNDMDIVTNDETVVPKSLIEQHGVPLLLNVLYGTKLKMIKYDKDNNFVLHDVEDEGIMVRKNVIIIKKKRFETASF